MNLYEKTYERPGNDCMLWDTITLVKENGDYILRRAYKASGWFGTDRFNSEIVLDGCKTKMKIQVSKYLKEKLLDDYFNVDEILGEIQ